MNSIVRLRFVCLALSGLLLFELPIALAEFTVDVRTGDLIISNPRIPVPPPGVPVAAGYLKIRNYGAETDRLVAAHTTISTWVEIHATTVTDGVMRMRHLEDGLELAGKAVTELEPGAVHLMFMGLKSPPVLGDEIEVELTFERAGRVPVRFFVVEPGAVGAMH